MDDYLTALPAEGELLGDKYRVDRVIGQGGMGVVLAATNTESNARVAIKFLLPLANDYPEIVERFAREARASMRITGRHVARVHEVGSLDDGRAFLVMDLLDGCDVREALRLTGTLPAQEAVDHVLEALEAVAEAHAKSVVHRDLKPANLFLADQPDGTVLVKVLDFGISKLKDDANALTKTFDVVGTPFYMAPEQLTNAKDVDERADIWSMGVILYELLSGKRPFDGRTMAEIIARVLRNNPPPLENVPEGLQAVIRHALAGKREDRFDDVGELALALVPFGGPGAAAQADRVVKTRGRSQRRVKVADAVTANAPKVDADAPAASITAVTVSSAEVPATKARSFVPALVVLVVLVAIAAAAWTWKTKHDAIATPATTGAPH